MTTAAANVTSTVQLAPDIGFTGFGVQSRPATRSLVRSVHSTFSPPLVSSMYCVMVS